MGAWNRSSRSPISTSFGLKHTHTTLVRRPRRDSMRVNARQQFDCLFPFFLICPLIFGFSCWFFRFMWTKRGDLSFRKFLIYNEAELQSLETKWQTLNTTIRPFTVRVPWRKDGRLWELQWIILQKTEQKALTIHESKSYFVTHRVLSDL